MIQDKIWIVGTGPMAVEHAKVLNSLGCTYEVIGRGEANAKLFFEATGVQPYTGGLDLFLNSGPGTPQAVINAVGIESLTETTQQLLHYGVKYLLLEKPGFAYPEEWEGTAKLALDNKAEIYIAYNRRFYASVLKAREMIEADGGCTSFLFEFTEWSHVISGLKKDKAELENWFYGNSTHVIDTAFFLGGMPVELSAYKAGSLPWHPGGSVYAGAGYTDKGALFSYTANWQSPGRWNLELCTPLRRLIFRPMEKLQIQQIGSIKIDFFEEIDYSKDEVFKPGTYLQMESFLQGKSENLIELNTFKKNIAVYNKINRK
ncbi:MAG: gfo/Idh/MocA family oxidoreductase [Bacteroidota bacterium]|nr:gfo/Idh/MocA family oxidoreductase [Bacteroidota bacterium]